MSDYDEAVETVRKELCEDCDACSEDMRNEIEGCACFQEDLKETLLNYTQFGAGA